MNSSFMNYLMRVRYEANELVIILKHESMMCIPTKAIRYIEVQRDESSDEEYLYFDSRFLNAQIFYSDIDVARTVQANEDKIEHQLEQMKLKEQKDERQRIRVRRKNHRGRKRRYRIT